MKLFEYLSQKQKLVAQVALLLFLFLDTTLLKAQTQEVVMVYNPDGYAGYTGSPVKIEQNNLTSLTYSLYSNLSANYPSKINFNKLVGTIGLEIDKDQLALTSPGVQTIELELEIKYEELNAIGTQKRLYDDPNLFTNPKLKIQYDPNRNVQELEVDLVKINEAIKIDVKIIAITIITSGGTTTPAIIPPSNSPPLLLKTTIKAEPIKDFFNFLTPLPSSLTHTVPVSSVDNNTILLSWSSHPNALNYEIEWLYLDQWITYPYTYDFRFNSTKIVLPSTVTHYHLSNIYEGGFVLYRVRAVGLDFTSDKPVSTPWSYNFADKAVLTSAPTGANVINIQGFEPNKNWIYSLSFAEENKRKGVISYYDGILKNRQTVTHLEESLNIPVANRDGTAIVAQTVYDFLGRPAIQILPVPSLDNSKLHYRDNFNKGRTSQTQYNWKDFDLDAAACQQTIVSEMSTASGAAHYYSPSSLATNYSINKDFIPNANGYPFAQVVYEPDNTGRIKMQSGVGREHRISGIDELQLPNTNSYLNSHESKFFYVKPSQEELFLLFGNEVGDASHYTKEVVQDPNGQVSIAIKNLSGNVIATALAGPNTNTPNLLPIDGNKVVDNSIRTLNLDYKSIINNSDNALMYAESFEITAASNYTIEYNVSPEIFQDPCLSNICFTCVYDLSIKLIDECGNEMIPNGPITRKVGNVESTNINTSCSTIVFNLTPQPISIPLPIGKYTLIKTLTVNEASFKEYESLYLNNTACVKTLEDFEEEELAKIDLRFCNYTCETCEEDVVKWQHLIDSITTVYSNDPTNEGYLKEKKRLLLNEQYQEDWCGNICDNKTICEDLERSILMDVSPGGQYALFDINDMIAGDANSVLNQNNTGSFRTPQTTAGNNYYNPLGEIELIEVKNNYPEPNVTNYTYFDKTGATWSSGTKYIKPQDLKDLATFLNFWEPYWAKSLMHLHPEYCFLTKCKDIEGTYIYNQQMDNIETSESALALGYFNPLKYVTPGNTGHVWPSGITHTTDYTPSQSYVGDPILTLNPTFVSSTLYGYMDDYITKIGNTVYTSNNKSIWSFWEYLLTLENYNFWQDNCANEMGWFMFRSLYQSAKTFALKEYYTAANCPAIPNGKAQRFYYDFEKTFDLLTNYSNTKADIIDVLSGNKTESTTINTQTAIHCTEICDAYVPAWKDKLSKCITKNNDLPFSTNWETTMSNLMVEMKAICTNGCDVQHPYGSREYKPGVTPPSNQTANFSDAINKYFKYERGVCESLVLSWPMKYNHDYYAYEGPNANDCACENQRYTPEYIAQKQESCPGWLPEGQAFEDCACEIEDEEVRKRVLLTKDVPVPNKCQNCIECQDVYNETFDFLTSKELMWPSQPYLDYLIQQNLPAPSLPDYSNEGFKMIYQNHMNLKFGFNLYYNDYQKYLSNCLFLPSANDSVFKLVLNKQFYVKAEIPQNKLNQSTEGPVYWVNISQNNILENPSAPKDIRALPNNPVDLWNGKLKNEQNQQNQWTSIFSTPSLNNVSKIQVTPQQIDQVKCNCEKVLNANKYAIDNATTLQVAFGVLYPGGGLNNLDDMKKYCCKLLKNEPITDDETPCDPQNYTPGDQWPPLLEQNIDMAQILSNIGQNWTYFGGLLDNPCTNTNPNPHSRLKRIDNCACNKLIALYKQFSNTASNELLKLDGVYIKQSDLMNMAKRCEDAWRFGENWEKTDKTKTEWSSTSTWTDEAKKALEKDAIWWELNVPCSLTCTGCGNVVTPPGGENPPASCGMNCLSLMPLINSFIQAHPLPNSTYNKFDIGLQITKIYTNNLTDPGVGQWFADLQTHLQNNISSLVPSHCLPYTINMSYIISMLEACAPVCPPLNCSQIQEALAFFLNTHSFPLDMQGISSNPSQILDVMLSEYLNSQTTPGYTSQYNLTNLIAFLNDFLQFSNTYFTDIPSCNRTLTVNSILGLRTLCSDFMQPSSACNMCYTTNSKYLNDFMVFLNEIVIGPEMITKKLNLLDKNNWYLENPIELPPRDLKSYYDHNQSDLYKWHSSKSALKYHLFSYPDPPTLSGEIFDGVNHNVAFELYYPSDAPMYHFGEIIQFSDIEMLKPAQCKLPSHFKMKALIYIPAKYAGPLLALNLISSSDEVDHPEDPDGTYYAYTITLSGFFPNKKLATATTCFKTCEQLCNKPFYPTITVEDDCEKNLNQYAFSNAQNRYNEYLAEKKKTFRNDYFKKCLGAEENFKGSKTINEYQYTLYYYDLAGNLIKTVPPEGVDADRLRQNGTIDEVNGRINACKAHVAPNSTSNRITTNHTLITNYQYNTLSQLIQQTTPDGGISRFWYDNLGRLIVSQNAKQAVPYTVNGNDRVKYSYSIYDAFGRITQVGEISKPNVTGNVFLMTNAIAADPAVFDYWLKKEPSLSGGVDANSDRKQVTSTIYDEPQITVGALNFSFDNARNRVVSTIVKETFDANNPYDFEYATHYSYDIHGNVSKVVQDNKSLAGITQQYKTMSYKYDLISGNVHQVTYQAEQPDQFIHYYAYDAENRLTEVYTSQDDEIKRLEAKYFYYLHGPLARVELGQNNLQGQDFAYTLHGWLKSVNGEAVGADKDMGNDGNQGTLNHQFARDAFGFTLHFYKQDYSAINATAPAFIANKTGSDVNGAFKELFNGNIMAMTTVLPDANLYGTSSAISMSPQMGVYHYDKLNRLKEMKVFTNYDVLNNQWQNTSATGTGAFYTHYNYDQNGNILNLTRNGGGSTPAMDQITYKYDYIPALSSGNPSPYPLLKSNKLYHVNDNPTYTTNYSNDIDDMGAFVNDNPATTTINEVETDNNFQYDELGNLIKDKAERIAEIKWNAYGKIASITRETTGMIHDKSDLVFEYNSAGLRVKKTVKPRDAGGNLKPQTDWIITHYIYDAKGNVMATYKQLNTAFIWEDNAIYGASRLGQKSWQLNLTTLPGTTTLLHYTYTSGNKHFELSNHLGNVLAVITDRKIAKDINADLRLDYFEVDYLSFTDYYPFGMQMKERLWSSGGYRYGFNGKEKDDEVSGEGNNMDFGARIYESRLGRWMSLDLKSKAFQSNYIFAKDCPITFIDPDGKDDYFFDKKDNTWSVVRTGIDAPNRYFVHDGSSKLTQSDGYFANWRQMEHTELIELISVNPKILHHILWNSSSEEGKKIFSDLQTLRHKEGVKIIYGALAVPIVVIGVAEFGPVNAAKEAAEEYIENKTGVPIGYIDIVKSLTKSFAKEVLEETGEELIEKAAKETGEQAAKGGLLFNYGVKEAFIKHFNSGSRHADLGLSVETMATKTMNLVEINMGLLKAGDNTLIGNINGIQKSFKVFVKDGKVMSVNMYSGVSNRVTQGTTIEIGNVSW